MTQRPLRCLVLNACGTHHPAKDLAEAWASRTATSTDRPDVVFIQEIPSEAWLQPWRNQKYQVAFGANRGWTTRSALLASSELPYVSFTADEMPTLGYHGEYLRGS
jgi:hypothetical protein